MLSQRGRAVVQQVYELRRPLSTEDDVSISSISTFSSGEGDDDDDDEDEHGLIVERRVRSQHMTLSPATSSEVAAVYPTKKSREISMLG
jgi:hypothetical protein